MFVLDLFFKLAVPFVIVSVIVAKVALGVDRTVGIYDSAAGEARRDQINRDYKTNRGSAVIAGIFVVLWGLTLAAMVESMGAVFFTFVIGALMIIPFMTVCACVIMVYNLAVHGYAHAKSRR